MVYFKNLLTLSIFAFCLVVLSGCGIIAANSVNEGNVHTLTNDELLHAISRSKSMQLFTNNLEMMYQEAVDRGMITHEEYNLIKNGMIQTGMSEDALICLKGFPSDINRTVFSGGVHKQYVYDYGKYGGRSYVYVENGVVTGWQD